MRLEDLHCMLREGTAILWNEARQDYPMISNGDKNYGSEPSLLHSSRKPLC